VQATKMIYLDRVATALLAPEVKAAITKLLDEDIGNPSAHIHAAGIAAGSYLDKAHEQVAGLISTSPNDIHFTSGATESNNLALKGYLRNFDSGEVIISEIEHYSIIDQLKNPELSKFKFRLLKVDRDGLVDPDELKKAIGDDTVLVSIITASPEIGSIQPIRELADICHRHNAVFHTDASAAAGYIPLDVKKLGVDMMTVSSQTLGGPMGMGAIYLKNDIKLNPLFDGGNQEMGLRPGTENVIGAVGFGAACEAAQKNLNNRTGHLKELGIKLRGGLQANIEHIEFTGHPERRLPGHVSFWHKFVEGESLLLHLNMKGVMAASGSACSSNLKGKDEHDLRASHVLTAVGVPEEYCSGSITFSLDYFNTEDEVKYVMEIMPEIVKRLEAMSPVYEDYIKQREHHG
jgi:cysteine desulfurase